MATFPVKKKTLKGIHIYLPSPHGIYGAYNIAPLSSSEIDYSSVDANGSYIKIKGELSGNTLTISFEGGNDITAQKAYKINALVIKQ